MTRPRRIRWHSRRPEGVTLHLAERDGYAARWERGLSGRACPSSEFASASLQIKFANLN
jgi:hypothetical protein